MKDDSVTAPLRIGLLTAAAMLAFAGNSILCRLALAEGAIAPGGFTFLRLLAGAITLALLVAVRLGPRVLVRRGSWVSAAALFAYAALFSLAYVRLSAGIGALVLFGLVQLTMVGWGLYRGERPGALQWFGFALSASGLGALTLWGGVGAPDPLAVALMAASGVAWGVYSLRGRAEVDPLGGTAGNFLRAVPLCVLFVPFGLALSSMSLRGAALALASGSLTSALGYVLWYAALRGLVATQAALVQLSVPMLAALGGVALLGEALTVRLVVAGGATLVGIALGQRRR